MMDPAKLREHTLNRVGYGAGPIITNQYDSLGFDAFIAEQLIPAPPHPARLGATASGKLGTAIIRRHQLESSLIDFWFNHFNVDANKQVVTNYVHDFLNDVIKPHVLGNFATMLAATAESTAMLDYLDNRLNYKEEIVDGEEFGLNENYARELLELHTLGVDGGYTQADIIDVARILTGWSLPDSYPLDFTFKADRHDDGPKTVLGVNFPSGRGKEEGDELLQMLAQTNAAAGFISYKLCQRYVNEAPAQSIVDAATATFLQTDGDLREVMRTILTSAEFSDEANFRTKVKPPLRYVASAVLAMGGSNAGSHSTVRVKGVEAIELMGEQPFHVAPPTGYPESSGFWMSGASMLERFRFAGYLAAIPTFRYLLKGRAGVDGMSATPTVNGIAAVICPGGISDATRAQAIAAAEAESQGDDRITAAAQIVLSSPEFVRF